MVHTKMSIFLFFLIFGTSVFPNGSSTGLAYAKPTNSQDSWNQLPLNDIIDQSLRLASQQPKNNWGSTISYGSITNSEGIQAEEQEELKTQFHGTQTPKYKRDNVIEALKIQKRHILNIIPESYVEQTNHVDKSQSGNRLRRDLNLNKYMPNFNKTWNPISNILNQPGPVISYGSRTVQKNNFYPKSHGNNIVYGSQDESTGNTYYSDNPNLTHIYGRILVQENNTYRGKDKNVQYGASVTQIGNKYQGHPGKNAIYPGVVVQNNNNYAENPGNKISLAIIILLINLTILI